MFWSIAVSADTIQRATYVADARSYGMDDGRGLLQLFERREWLQRLKANLMIAFGIPLSFLAPVVLSTMFWLTLKSASRSLAFASGVDWLDLFVVLAVVTIPLLYRLELRTDGDYLSSTLDEANVHSKRGLIAVPGTAGLVVAASSIAANPRAASSPFVEIFLSGPRLVIGGLRHAKLARRVRLDDKGPAADIVAALLERDRGVETTSLVPHGETLDALLPALAYLTFHRWIGVGEAWGRIWLDSESKRHLQGQRISSSNGKRSAH